LANFFIFSKIILIKTVAKWEKFYRSYPRTLFEMVPVGFVPKSAGEEHIFEVTVKLKFPRVDFKTLPVIFLHLPVNISKKMPVKGEEWP